MDVNAVNMSSLLISHEVWAHDLRSNEAQDVDIESSRDGTMIKGDLLPSRVFRNKEKLETFGITPELRQAQMEAEYYHYLTIQIRWNTIMPFAVSIFGLLICIISYLSMDYVQLDQRWGLDFMPPSWLEQFAF